MDSKPLAKIRKMLSRWIGNPDKKQSLPVISSQEGYELWASNYGEDMNPVQALESEALRKLLPPLRDCTVLDLGCGKGRVSQLALEKGAKTTVGLDSSLQMLGSALAETRSPAAHFLAGEASQLPFKKETFDVVIGALIMGHLQSPETVLSQIYRVLRPGGFLLISDFHPYQTLRGSVRSFRDPKSNRSYAIEQHPHLFEDYMRIFNALGFLLEDLRERLYEDFPLVFALRARKTGFREAVSSNL